MTPLGLSGPAVRYHLDRLQRDLSPRQRERLTRLADAIDEDGRIPLPRALEIATPGGDEQTAQATFRKFRSAVNAAIEEAGGDLRLVADGQRSAPAGRFCWFEGADTTEFELAELSAREADRTVGDKLVAPAVAEVLPEGRISSVTVYVSADRPRPPVGPGLLRRQTVPETCVGSQGRADRRVRQARPRQARRSGGVGRYR